MPTIVMIENTYADRSNTETVTVESPNPVAPFTTDDLEDWWEDKVFPHTGDGGGGYAVYTATVMSSDVPGLVGLTWSWEG